jgi:hypothetical protein
MRIIPGERDGLCSHAAAGFKNATSRRKMGIRVQEFFQRGGLILQARVFSRMVAMNIRINHDDTFAAGLFQLFRPDAQAMIIHPRFFLPAAICLPQGSFNIKISHSTSTYRSQPRRLPEESRIGHIHRFSRVDPRPPYLKSRHRPRHANPGAPGPARQPRAGAAFRSRSHGPVRPLPAPAMQARLPELVGYFTTEKKVNGTVSKKYISSRFSC